MDSFVNAHGIAFTDDIGIITAAKAHQCGFCIVFFLKLDSGFHCVFIPGIDHILKPVFHNGAILYTDVQFHINYFFYGCENFQIVLLMITFYLGLVIFLKNQIVSCSHVLLIRFSPEKMISFLDSNAQARVMFRDFPMSTARAVGLDLLTIMGILALAAFWTSS